ncbi:E3 ubiquitin-protein ligase TRIM37-like [Armigeres subalbatus]|uniref:E3 ubiquitin-protein ligase TRIM37-like n=1 Tax=Armigeres subalbatus TaxID=124917 RepID=UPI002ED53235
MSDQRNQESKLTVLLECCICFYGLRECHICAECSQPFCRECIHKWLYKQSCCPYCRACIRKDQLIRFYLIDQLHDEMEQFLAEQKRNRCVVHESQQLLLVCLRCEQCVCVDCWYSDEHVEHKDEIVPMEIAFDHYYRETIRSGQLNKGDNGENVDLQNKIKVLFEEKRDAMAMNQILKTMEKLRINNNNITS